MPSPLTPSNTLKRAAAADRDRIERARQRIHERQESLREELTRLDAELSELDERSRVLDLVAGEPSDDREPASAPSGRSQPALRGAQVRELAARRFFLEHGAGKAMHYRRWFELFTSDGSEIGGKDPLAAFLTNLNRSPVVTKGSDPGTYMIDAGAIDRLREQLGERQAELSDLSQVIAREVEPSEQLRGHRARLLSDIRRLEGQLAEAQRVLAPRVAAATEQQDDRRAA